MSIPDSGLFVCTGVRLNNSYTHTIWFSSVTEQSSYFASKCVRNISPVSYIRKGQNSIKVSASMVEAYRWSYLYYWQSKPDKFVYCFINRVEYVNDSTVELFIEIDVMQTYMFDYALLECFVEREHAASDEIGENCVEENLDTGELEIASSFEIGGLSELCVLVLATYDPMTTSSEYTNTTIAAKYDGIYSGLGVYAVPMSSWQAWGTKMLQLDEYGKSDGIVSMWMYPKALVQLATGETWGGKACHSVTGTIALSEFTGRRTTLAGGYEPRNKKLLTYPYQMLYVTNNSGVSATYRFERFANPSDCVFKIVGTLSPEGVVRMYPINYNGAQHNYEAGLTLGGYPTCAWNQDMYKLWLAQNQNQHSLGMAIAGGKILSGLGVAVGASFTGAGALAGGGMVLSGVNDIQGLLAQRADREIQPPQARGQASGSVNLKAGFQTFTVQNKAISKEYAMILDDFFDMYGYAQNKVKMPVRYARQNWTYTKTRGCQIKGDLGTDDIVKIQGIYDKGITFWVRGDFIGDYEQPNGTLLD